MITRIILCAFSFSLVTTFSSYTVETREEIIEKWKQQAEKVEELIEKFEEERTNLLNELGYSVEKLNTLTKEELKQLKEELLKSSLTTSLTTLIESTLGKEIASSDMQSLIKILLFTPPASFSQLLGFVPSEIIEQVEANEELNINEVDNFLRHSQRKIMHTIQQQRSLKKEWQEKWSNEEERKKLIEEYISGRIKSEIMPPIEMMFTASFLQDSKFTNLPDKNIEGKKAFNKAQKYYQNAMIKIGNAMAGVSNSTNNPLSVKK
jgi:hypothetical protein